ncbi:MAG: DUF917 domain-containing protein [Candidatus Kariarchaeaceae archaeon]|jgi:DUF917 family protein
MTERILSRQETLDLVFGAKIMACGGGGSEREAIVNINREYDRGRQMKIAQLTDFHSDDMICIIGEVGGGITDEDKKIIEHLGIVQNQPMILAVEQLENLLKTRFKAFVATELGPWNSIVPLLVAAQMEDKVAIDGDCCGRSKPKISISTTTVKNIPIAPFCIASKFGDKLSVNSTYDDARGEVLARTIARISNGSVGVARCPMTIEKAQNAVIPNTLSLAIELGKKVRETNVQQGNPIDVIEKTIPGTKLVFTGRVTSFTRIEEGGFTSGEIILDSNTSDTLRIYYQNEYLLSWLNNENFVTCPDSLIIVDSNTGYGLTPWENDFETGRMVCVFAKDAPGVWQSKEGLKVFGPHQFENSWSEYKRASSFGL